MAENVEDFFLHIQPEDVCAYARIVFCIASNHETKFGNDTMHILVASSEYNNNVYSKRYVTSTQCILFV